MARWSPSRRPGSRPATGWWSNCDRRRKARPSNPSRWRWTWCSRTRICWSSTSPPDWSCIRRPATGAEPCSTACWPGTPGLGDLPRAGIVHRLDKDTSGLMLVARTRSSMDALIRMIAERTVQRQYLALAHKRWTGPSPARCALAIGRDPRIDCAWRSSMPQRTGAKDARTTVELLANAHDGLPGPVQPAHRAHAPDPGPHGGNRPSPGWRRDVWWRCRDSGSAAARRCTRFDWRCPIRQLEQMLEFVAPLPADLQAAMAQWGLRYNAPDSTVSPRLRAG